MTAEELEAIRERDAEDARMRAEDGRHPGPVEEDRAALLAAVDRLRAAEAILRRLVAAWDGTVSVYDVVAEARAYFGEGGE